MNNSDDPPSMLAKKAKQVKQWGVCHPELLRTISGLLKVVAAGATLFILLSKFIGDEFKKPIVQVETRLTQMATDMEYFRNELTALLRSSASDQSYQNMMENRTDAYNLQVKEISDSLTQVTQSLLRLETQFADHVGQNTYTGSRRGKNSP